MLQYYTLEEAAKLLGMHPDGAKKVLDDRKVRQYRDGRGGVRYVASAVDELARSLGRGSDPELPLGEAPRSKSGSTPRPTRAARGEAGSPPDDSSVPIGAERADYLARASQKSAGRGSGRGAGTKSPAPRSPAPKPGTDSDVRLVSEGSDLQINVDSDVKIVDEAPSSKTGAPSSSARRKSPPPAEAGDSGV